MNDEPTIGSPPIPTIVEQPSPSCVSSWPIWYVSVPERETSPTDPFAEDLGRDDPDVRLPRRQRARAVRPDETHVAILDERVEPQHLVCRDALGDADDGRDPGADRLVHRIGGERGGDEDHRRVRGGLAHGGGDRVEHGDALDVLPALARSDARDDVRSVRAVPQPVEPSLGAGQALDDEPCVRSRRGSPSGRELHRATRAVEHRRLGLEVRERRVAQDRSAFLGIRPVEAHDDRKLEPHLLDRLQDPARNLVAARDATEDVEEDRRGPSRPA